MAYETGYRRPPKSGQFKNGNSGNPKGRPKGSKNFEALLQKELNESVVVNENGKKRTLTRMQAMVKKMVSGALQGDQKALITLVEIMRRSELFKDKTDVVSLAPNDYELILDTFIEKREQSNRKKSDKSASREK